MTGFQTATDLILLRKQFESISPRTLIKFCLQSFQSFPKSANMAFKLRVIVPAWSKSDGPACVSDEPGQRRADHCSGAGIAALKRGAIGALTQSVLRQACLEARVEARAFDPGLRLSINTAAAQLEDVSLADELLAVLHKTGFDPRRLEVELTEHALARDGHVGLVGVA